MAKIIELVTNAGQVDVTQGIVEEAAKAVPKALADPEPFIVIGAYKESRIEYIVRVWCNSADYWDVYFGMNEQVRESFNARGVKLTYDHINVHMVQ